MTRCLPHRHNIGDGPSIKEAPSGKDGGADRSQTGKESRQSSKRARREDTFRHSREACCTNSCASSNRGKDNSGQLEKVGTDCIRTKDDLLAFQSTHFGDDTKPDNWFVDAETAFNVQPTWAEDEDLGFYADGAKRTLTDEQIEMFRHSEIEQLLRERRLREDEEDYQHREPRGTRGEVERSPSSASGRSSLEGDLCDLAKPAARSATRPSPTRKPSQSSRSESSKSTGNPGTWKRQRKKEVPYDERHKRRWEDFIEDNDPIEGSMTFRRNARELDDRQEQPVLMDY